MSERDDKNDAWPIERLEDLRQQYINSGNSRAAAVAYINGLHYELKRSLVLKGAGGELYGLDAEGWPVPVSTPSAEGASDDLALGWNAAINHAAQICENNLADDPIGKFGVRECAEAIRKGRIPVGGSIPSAIEPRLVAYLDSLFVSGNDVPVQRAWLNADTWQIIKECLADGTPLVHHVIEAEAVWRSAKARIEATGDIIRRESPLAKLRTPERTSSSSTLTKGKP